jgi:hypothetical protein
LICDLFENWNVFKRRFCEEFANCSETEVDAYKLITRRAFPFDGIEKITRNIGRTKIVPDMLLYSERKREIVLIENKIFSGEGYRQTEEYASPEYAESIKSVLPNMNSAKLKYWFMTLDDDKPVSEQFMHKKWPKMVITCCENWREIEDARLRILTGDLYARAAEYEECPSPRADESLEAYIKEHRKHWNTSRILFGRFWNLVVSEIKNKYPKINFELSSSHNMTGEQLHCIAFCDRWKRGDVSSGSLDEPFLQNEEKDCFNIHVELTWVAIETDMKLTIHYETNPYRTRSELESTCTQAFIEHYKKRREHFKSILHKEIHRRNSECQYSWHPTNYPLEIAKCKLSIAQSFTEIKNKYEKQFEAAYEMIESTLIRWNQISNLM